MPYKKVLFISSWFPDRITRSNGDFIKRHAQTAATNNDVVALFVKHDPGMQEKKELVESQEGNYREVLIYFKRKEGIAHNFLKIYSYLKLYLWGYKYVLKKYFEPDLIHANITFPIGIIAYIYHLLFKKPYVISEHWSAYLSINNSKLSFWRKLIDKKVVRSAALMLPVTKNMKESLIGLGYKAKYVVLPNVVNIERFSPSDKPTEIKTFIHLSTLNDKVKNISGMMQAVKKLSEKRKDFKLEIVGLENVVEHIEYAKKLGIYGKFVSVDEEIAHDEVPDRLRKSTCLLMFSNFESLPCIIIEALASGIPIISSDVGGIKEYISKTEGILIPKGDIDKLLEAMDFMLDNFESFSPKHLRDFAISNFSPKAIAHQLDVIYQSIPIHA